MLAENCGRYEILTPSGWKDFKYISVVYDKKTTTIIADGGLSISATESHYFFVSGVKLQTNALRVGMMIDTASGVQEITEIHRDNMCEAVYDIIEVDEPDHKYFANSFVVKNCDELAFVRNTIAEEFFTSIMPTLSTGGSCIITSTPVSDEDLFWRIWTDANKQYDDFGNITELGKNGFFPYMALWTQHPDRGEVWEKQQRELIGDERFEREMNCKTITYEETLIDSMILSSIKSSDPIRKSGEVRWFKDIDKRHKYVVTLDPSLGTGGDYAAIQVFDVTTFEQVAEWRHNKTIIQKQVRILRDILQELFSAVKQESMLYFTVENNSVGEAALVAIDEMGEHTLHGTFVNEPKKAGNVKVFRKGLNTTNKNKLGACAKLKQLIESKNVKIHSKLLISELKTFIATGASYAARTGDTDDLVMSTILVVRCFQIIQKYDESVFDKLRQMEGEELVLPMPIVIF